MRLYIMRHGPAEAESASGRDFDRALTSAGRDRTQRVARKLEEQGEAPRHIVTSPYVRTVETAAIVREVLALDEPLAVRAELVPDGSPLLVLRDLLATDRKRVLIVSHEPEVSAMAASLLGSWDQGFDKAMVVGIRADRASGQGKLLFVLEPKHLSWREPE